MIYRIGYYYDAQEKITLFVVLRTPFDTEIKRHRGWEFTVFGDIIFSKIVKIIIVRFVKSIHLKKSDHYELRHPPISLVTD